MIVIAHGLVNLMKECGHLVNTAALRLAFSEVTHVDPNWEVTNELEDAIGNVQASISFVIEKFKLNKARIEQKSKSQLALYKVWDEREKEKENTNEPHRD